jgi:LPPG:FO 2-phospho-L-lactate transferase
MHEVSVTYSNGKVVALAGGVGGAKLVQGLAAAIPGHDLTAIVNTADDFSLWGLHISPDLDTVMYTLAGLANPATGWGIAGDTRATLDAIARYGEDPWFLVGDQDIATHILRTHRLRSGQPLSTITGELVDRLGIEARLLPMTDDGVATQVRTADGWLAFQDYFVARRHADDVLDVRFTGIETARPAAGVLEAIAAAETIILCPSNPLVSIGPILAVPGIREAIAASRATVAAVSPIVGGKALKGPADRMLEAKGVEVSAVGVARFYEGLVDVVVIDEVDRDLAGPIEALGMQVAVRQTIMGDAADRARLAGEILRDIAALPSTVRP